ncbi:hypothetical protein roselon_03011 [Roseibacterium elongatum DSM 19469]|uniref:Ferrous iron transporter FeoA-like domain-containing protein n=1 Tax=Roseicyclus elongatus DSM 19469 TaxID=1294273 RepID=W8SRX7_9RHOB|nr:FeoA family protein [Roseibacterium elongatum]AHM05290.1 hypothetical protein roselon_03011 [Roseibacterium elongatum DSM 19469]
MIKGYGWRHRRRHRHRQGGHGPCGSGGVCAGGARSLDQMAPPAICTVRRLHGCGPARQRLLDLGFQPGREIKVLRNAPLYDPVEVQVGDTFIALRRTEARHVEVSDD